MADKRITDFDVVLPEDLPDDAVVYTVLPAESTSALIDRKWTWTNFKTWIINSLKLNVDVTNEKRPAIDNTIIPHFIGEEYTNLIQDPTDLTTVNWTKVSGVIASVTALTVNELPFIKLSVDGTTNPQIYQTFTVVDSAVKHTGYFLLRKGTTSETTDLYLLQTGSVTFTKGWVTIDWTIKTVTSVVGSLEYNWLDDETVEIWITTLTGETGFTSWVYRIDPQSTAGIAGNYIYATACQFVEDTITMFPFVDGSHVTDAIDVEQTMPDKITFDMIIEPKFAYDTTDSNKPIFAWYIDPTHKLFLFYEETSDIFRVYWIDGGTGRTLSSQQFDDGTTYIDINQRIRFIGSLDLTSGGINDSRFIVIPLESGTLNEGTSWSGTPDAKTSTFPTFGIGNDDGTIPFADSEYEYLRIYEGLLVSDVSFNSDAEVLLQNMSMIFEAIPDAFIPREISVDTPISSAIQQLANDVRTGQGIQNGAILERHLRYGSTHTALIALASSVWNIGYSAADNNWNGIAYGNGLFVAVADSGIGNRVMTSPDGITWTIRTSAADNYWQGITYGNGLFVAVADSGIGNRVMTSPDGITWTIRTSAADNNWNGIAYGNGQFVAVADSGIGNRVMTSPDGITWTIRTSAADNNWNGIAYGNGQFVAVAASGIGNRVMTSPDGITWTIRTSAADNNWNGIAYGNGQFVAVADSGIGNRVMTSPDGITWTIRTSAADNNWSGIAYGNGLFVVVAGTGTGNRVMTSPDGITWTIRTSAADNSWSGIAYGNGLFVAVADSGTGNRVMKSLQLLTS